MANTPNPRSRSQLISDGMDPFVAAQGLPGVKVGDPLFSLFEAVAQSQLRNQNDIFQNLRSISLDYAEKQALDRIGADELLPRLQEKAATGYVTIKDTSFTKISSQVFRGAAPPIVGSTTIKVQDASLFPSSGQIYIGRGTENLEGPITYSSKTAPPGSGGTYWLLTLSSNTLRPHNTGEAVTLAQGGDRTIAAANLPQTPQGTASTSIQYRLARTAIIPDGETEIQNVLVVAVKPGQSGNIIANSISGFSTDPFPGATVTNPSPFITGQSVEKDDAYRARIRLARLSRSLGTPTAITTAATGVTSDVDSKRVTSARYVEGTLDTPSVLYIDDSTGYQETTQGVAYEALTTSADGGETTFKVSNTPIAKARLEATLQAPYNLSANQRLAFSVGGVVTETAFTASQFKDITGASAYEVVNAINQDGQLNWAAKLSQEGLSFYVIAKGNTQEDIQLVEASEFDAAASFAFPTKKAYTINLYKNDRILTKDGIEATIYSESFGNWGNLTGDQTLTIKVDGISLSFDGSQFPKFTYQDFINAKTGSSVLAKNSLQAWAAVFNYRIPGVTATVVGSTIALTSSRDADDAASIEIVSGTLVTNGVFSPQLATGATKDYSLNRNTGQIHLAQPLQTGDTLTVGSTDTQAFLQSEAFTSLTFPSNPKFYFAVDGEAEIITTGVQTNSTVTLTRSAEAWGYRQSINLSGAFDKVQAGDFLIVTDPALASLNISGTYRIREASSSTIMFDVSTAVGVNTTTNLTNGGIWICRSNTIPDSFTLPATVGLSTAVYTPDTVVANASSPAGLTLKSYKTKYLRASSNKLDDGDIAYVATNLAGENLPLTIGSEVATQNEYPTVTSTPAYTPFFWAFNQSSVANDPLASYTTATVQDFDPFFTGMPELLVKGMHALPDTHATRYGNHKGFLSPVQVVDTSAAPIYDWSTRHTPLGNWLQDEVFTLVAPYQFNASDTTTVLVDQDEDQRRFVVPMSRRVTPTFATYGASNYLSDAENGGVSLAAAFGYGANAFNFEDFAVHMPARAVVDTSISNTKILWRYNRLGPDGNFLFLTYGPPDGPSASPSYTTEIKPYGNGYTRVELKYGSGALKTGYTLPSGYPMAVFANNLTGSADMAEYAYILGYQVISFTRTANVSTIRLQYPTSALKNSGLQAGASYNFQTSSAAPSGVWNFTGVAISEWVPASGVFDKFVFADPGPNVGTVSGNVGWLYFAPSSTASFTNGLSPATQNDYFRAEASSGLAANFTGKTGSILNTPSSYNGLYIKCLFEDNQAAPTISSTATLTTIEDPAGIEIFANGNQTAASLVTAWNSISGIPIKGTNLDTGAGILTKSLSELNGTVLVEYYLWDGINWIQSQVSPTIISDNYQFTFKVDPDPTLATADWLNETIKLVPTTAKNVVDWFNCVGVSALAGSATAKLIDAGASVQLSSNTPGTDGSVYVQSGEANNSSVAVKGSPELLSWATLLDVDQEDASGLRAASWVSVQNNEVLPKTTSFTSGLVVSAIGTDGTLTLSQPTYAFSSSATDATMSFQKCGEFMVFSGTATMTGAVSGDYIKISAPTTPGSDVNALNAGIFRIHSIQQDTVKRVWYKNPLGVEEREVKCNWAIMNSQSIVPGDILNIGTTMYGVGNIGQRVVVDVGDGWTDNTKLKVDVSVTPTSAYTGAATIGSQLPLFQIIENQPVELTKYLVGIFPSANDASRYTLVLLGGHTIDQKFGASAGTVITSKAKLGFPLDLTKGHDGYAYNTGLLQEVNRVVYGDQDNPTVYPGVAAEGSTINLEGAFIKRLQISVLIRSKLGFNQEAIKAKVRSAIAAIINTWPNGTPIPFSKIIGAAEKVVGVGAVTILSPTYSASSDRIPVADQQKALILDVENDVTVSFTS